MITPSTAVLGLLTSIVTELLKLIPILNRDSVVRSITAIVVLAAGTVLFAGKFDFETFIGGLVFALTSYKTVIQPVAGALESPTQA